jgi:sulfide:quinone oxidoreductase
LLEEYLGRKGVRGGTELTFVSPLERPFPIDSVSDVVERFFGLRGVRMENYFTLGEVRPAERQAVSVEGRALSYDLLVMVPPHRGAKCLERHALADGRGWVRTDPRSLLARGHTAVWALGDAADLPVSKTGSGAHFQVPVVVEQIVAAVEHRRPDPARAVYGGHVVCFLEVGHNQATIVDYDYENAPVVKDPNVLMHYLKMAFNQAYFHLVPTGVV